MDLKPNQKICPQCYFVNEDFAKVCIKCSYSFPKDSIKENPDDNNEPLDNTQEPSVKKCDNPKAPKKTCPSCGAKVYINRAICPECDHHFEFKSKKATSPIQTENKKEKIERSPGMPLKSYFTYVIILALWFLACYFLLPLLYTKIGIFVIIVDFIAFFVSMGVGVLGGMMSEGSYEYRSSGYALGMSIISVIGILLFDYFQIKSVWATSNFEGSLIHTLMLIVITAEVITQAINYYISIKEYYCHRCGMANLVFLEKTEDGESHVDYKFITHEAETHTATVTADSKYKGSIGSVTPEHFEADRSTTYTIKYKTPEWQENLGLHKYTKYTNVYRCKRCGYIKKENGTREEKI